MHTCRLGRRKGNIFENEEKSSHIKREVDALQGLAVGDDDNHRYHDNDDDSGVDAGQWCSTNQ
jgi:hypothetical protein